MKHERKRINISLLRFHYDAICELAAAGGFKNACAFVRSLLIAVAGYAAAHRLSPEERARQPTNIHGEIEDMFKELIDWDAASPAQQRAAIMANEKQAEK